MSSKYRVASKTLKNLRSTFIGQMSSQAWKVNDDRPVLDFFIAKKI